MADDLTALLRREIQRVANDERRLGILDDEVDALAARLAEAVRKWLWDGGLSALFGAIIEQRSAARQSESEALELLRELVECPQPSSDYANAFQQARAYLARREEARHRIALLHPDGTPKTHNELLAEGEEAPHA